MANINLDRETFHRRLRKLYAAWQRQDGDGGGGGLSKADCLVAAVGVDDDVVYSKSGALQSWLLGYELTDTIMVFAEGAVYFLASKKKIDFLRQAENAKDDSGIGIKLLVRDRNDKDEANFKTLIGAIKGSRNGKTIGVFAKENYPGYWFFGFKGLPICLIGIKIIKIDLVFV